jgi:hypothetical protein
MSRSRGLRRQSRTLMWSSGATAAVLLPPPAALGDVHGLRRLEDDQLISRRGGAVRAPRGSAIIACYGLRSERRLTQEVELHLAYRWFCRLDLNDKVPHHSTFSENRLHRFRESDVFRHIFERVVATCMASGLVKGEGFAVDASVMEANASRYHGKAPDEIVWAEPECQTRAVREYLAALEAEAEPNPDRKPPKVLSPSDPCAAWTAKANKRVQFGYGLNYLIDIENAVIVDVEPTPARTYDEVQSTKIMLDRTERCFGIKPKRLAADTAYGTGRFLGWLVGHGIAPHIPVRDASERDDGTFSRSDFRWDRRRGVYICPNNKVLHTTGTVHDGTMLRYRASKFERWLSIEDAVLSEHDRATGAPRYP